MTIFLSSTMGETLAKRYGAELGAALEHVVQARKRIGNAQVVDGGQVNLLQRGASREQLSHRSDVRRVESRQVHVSQRRAAFEHAVHSGRTRSIEPGKICARQVCRAIKNIVQRGTRFNARLEHHRRDLVNCIGPRPRSGGQRTRFATGCTNCQGAGGIKCPLAAFSERMKRCKRSSFCSFIIVNRGHDRLRRNLLRALADGVRRHWGHPHR